MIPSNQSCAQLRISGGPAVPNASGVMRLAAPALLILANSARAGHYVSSSLFGIRFTVAAETMIFKVVPRFVAG